MHSDQLVLHEIEGMNCDLAAGQHKMLASYQTGQKDPVTCTTKEKVVPAVIKNMPLR